MNTLYLIRESWSATHSILHRHVYLDIQSRNVRANRGTWVWPLTAGNPDTRRSLHRPQETEQVVGAGQMMTASICSLLRAATA
jgi:hypothetical protein